LREHTGRAVRYSAMHPLRGIRDYRWESVTGFLLIFAALAAEFPVY
jgi:hypothetical protein